MSNPKKNSDSPKQAVKSTKAQVNQRVSEIQSLLLEGYTRSHILQYATKWGMSDGMIDKYIAEATKNIEEINQAGLQNNLATVVSGLWDVYRKAKATADLGEMRQTLMAIAKIKGLDQTTVNHIIDDKRELMDMSDEDLEAALNNTTEH